MSLKMLVTCFAVGSLLMACGGPPPEADMAGETTPLLGTTNQGVCEGYENGARTCTAKCNSNSEWIYLAWNVDKNDCQHQANLFCKHQAYGACWSKI